MARHATWRHDRTFFKHPSTELRLSGLPESADAVPNGADRTPNEANEA